MTLFSDFVIEISTNFYKYLGQSKSSDRGILILYKKLKETFALNSLIVKTMLDLSMRLNHSSTNIIITIKLRQRAICYNI